MNGLTDNEIRRMQELMAASAAGLEAMKRPWTYADGEECVRDFNGTPLFERLCTTEADARYVVAVVNLMPRLLGCYLELRAGSRRPDSDTNKEQDR